MQYCCIVQVRLTFTSLYDSRLIEFLGAVYDTVRVWHAPLAKRFNPLLARVLLLLVFLYDITTEFNMSFLLVNEP